MYNVQMHFKSKIKLNYQLYVYGILADRVESRRTTSFYIR